MNTSQAPFDHDLPESWGQYQVELLPFRLEAIMQPVKSKIQED